MMIPRVVATLTAGLIGVLGLVAIIGVLAIAPAAESTIELQAGPSSFAVGDIPPAYLTLYEDAAQASGIDWAILAAIGEVETDHGRLKAPGVTSGANSKGAEGPMQFLSATFAAYALPTPPGGAAPASPYDPTDAIYAAARYLAASGATAASTVPAAIYAYNHSHAYVANVLATAQRYRAITAQDDATGTAPKAVRWALDQFGTPYVWGGETPGVAFDCSGLVQAAYHAAGIALPRVAQDQYNATTLLPQDQTPLPGDLVFFGSSTTDIQHVGIVLTPGTMIDAPHTGAVVGLDTYPVIPGSAWGDETFIGTTRPIHATAPGAAE